LTITRFSYKKIAHSFSYITAPALQNTTPKKAGPAFGAFFSWQSLVVTCCPSSIA
jgi:hypothetical protein